MYILDCTLRDGGYYNNWDFPVEVVNEYLDVMSQVGVNIVELGLRTLKKNSFKGASAYTSESYLQSLKLPNNLKVSVMINASELLSNPLENISYLFDLNSANSKVDIVRIACHKSEIIKIGESVQYLLDQGYQVVINLMQITSCSDSSIQEILDFLDNFNISCFYIADSTGSAKVKDIDTIVNKIKIRWEKDLGIHAHDNMGLALENTLAAIHNGVSWIDSTVTGMGRGPGNVKTEELLIELFGCNPLLIKLFSLIESYFSPLKSKCKWGTNHFYYLSGKYSIHPSYIQEALSDESLTNDDVFYLVNYLKEIDAKKYDIASLKEALSFYAMTEGKSFVNNLILKDKEVLLVANGPSTHKYQDYIHKYISKYDPVVIELNFQNNSFKCDYLIASHPLKIISDSTKYREKNIPVIMPFSQMPLDLSSKISYENIVDFGIEINSSFLFSQHKAIVPSQAVLAYALGFVNASGATSIKMVGFDGYKSGDRRNDEINNIFNLYHDSDLIKPISLTKTYFNVNEQSIFSFV